MVSEPIFRHFIAVKYVVVFETYLLDSNFSLELI